jgi:hypothetical protein
LQSIALSSLTNPAIVLTLNMPLLFQTHADSLINAAEGSFCFLTSEDYEDAENNRVVAFRDNRGTWFVYPA